MVKKILLNIAALPLCVIEGLRILLRSGIALGSIRTQGFLPLP